MRLKNYFIFTLLLSSIVSTFAQPTIYTQLCALNEHWKFIEPKGELLEQKQFLSAQEIITYHLQQVEKHLAKKNIEHLSKEIQCRRKEGLEVLRTYWKRGLYPKNNQFNFRIPFFIDDANAACAVGYIMQGTGKEALAKNIAKTQNNAYVKEMIGDDILEWATNYGFAVDELAWIQPTYESCKNHYRPYVEPKIVKPTCGNSDGSIEFIHESIISYQWKHGANDLHLTNLTPGIYEIKGTMLFRSDQICPFEDFLVLESDNKPSISVGSISNETCRGLKDGKAEVTINNAMGQYDINWFNGDTTAISSNLTGGGRSYVSVTDEANCTAIGSVWFSTVYGIGAGEEVSPSICESNTGAIDLSTNINYNYAYNWADGDTLKNRTNLASGNYSVNITNDDGCFIKKNIAVYDDCDGKISCNDDYVTLYNKDKGFIYQFENDTDRSKAKMEFIQMSKPTHGYLYTSDYLWDSFILNKFTKIVYHPLDENYTGRDSFSYTVCTDYGFCDSAIVHVNLVNQPFVRVINLESTDMIISKGENIRLCASGAHTYSVSPDIDIEQYNNTGFFKASPAQTTTYTFTGTTNDGLTDTYDVTIRVIGDTVIPDYETMDDEIQIRVDGNKKNLIHITGQLQMYQIMVHDFSNDAIINWSTLNNTATIDISGLNDGLHYLNIQHKNYPNVISSTIIQE